MDWIQEEFEVLPIPTFPGSSLSVYYDNLGNGSHDVRDEVQQRDKVDDVDDVDEVEAQLVPMAQQDTNGSDYEDGDQEGEEDEEEGQDQVNVGGTQMKRPEDDVIAYDEYGFVELTDPGLEEALNLREPPPSFDETGLTTYNELCKSMGLTPISRFARQLNEDVVDLKFYGVNPRTVRAIAQALMYNPSVQTLDLTGNWLSDEAAYYLSELLLRENIALRRLILKGCKLSARAAALLAEGVELNHSVVTLDLSDNELGDDGIKALQDALAQNDEIRELDLSNNHLGSEAASYLGNALLENQTLEVLRLARNYLYEDVPNGLRVLLRAIQQRETPFHLLDLAWNALNVAAAVPLRAFLVKSTVRQLFLNNNRFPGPAIDTIKVGVGKSSTLQHLKIGFNPMEPENAMNLLQACQKSESIQILDLDGIRVNRDFLKIKNQLEASKGINVIIEGALSNYEIVGPNTGHMMLKRARFEGLKPKRKKRKKDFGHLLLELAQDGKVTLRPDQFTELALKKKKIKVREELLRGLYEKYHVNKTQVDVAAMLNSYMELFPDTVLPLPKPRKKKKKRKGKRQKKKVKK